MASGKKPYVKVVSLGGKPPKPQKQHKEKGWRLFQKNKKQTLPESVAPVLPQESVMTQQEPIQARPTEQVTAARKSLTEMKAELMQARQSEPILKPAPVLVQEPEMLSMPEPVLVQEPETLSMPEPVLVQEPEMLSMPEPVLVQEPETLSMPEPVLVQEPEVLSMPEPVLVRESEEPDWAKLSEEHLGEVPEKRWKNLTKSVFALETVDTKEAKRLEKAKAKEAKRLQKAEKQAAKEQKKLERQMEKAAKLEQKEAVKAKKQPKVKIQKTAGGGMALVYPSEMPAKPSFAARRAERMAAKAMAKAEKAKQKAAAVEAKAQEKALAKQAKAAEKAKAAAEKSAAKDEKKAALLQKKRAAEEEKLQKLSAVQEQQQQKLVQLDQQAAELQQAAQSAREGGEDMAKKTAKTKLPKQKKQKSGGGVFKKLATVLVVIVLAGGLGTGGFFAWKFFTNRNADPEILEDPVVAEESQAPANPAALEAVEAGVEVANAAAVLATGGVLPPTDNPGEITQDENGATVTPEPEPFQFSEQTFLLPADTFVTGSPLEQRVQKDLSTYLSGLDDRPGVQMTSVVVCGETTSPDGLRRALVYVLGNRYAVAQTTLFDYGMLAGPMALDYDDSGLLVHMVLPRAGDAFEETVKEFCMDRTDVARRMTKGSYDLELLAKMAKSVVSYISRNHLDIDFFRLGSQVYNKDGTIRVVSVQAGEQSSDAEDTVSSQPEQPVTDEDLEEDYQYYKDLPQ